ncbi:helix-turn-helix domain-containing protein [Bergeyella zoohelcum]|uniref:helix-turn-helix domain-containing protein n=1 Tax=Bergeyella zoohelcum TaxID=1015 RepID=UPI003735387B
MYKNIQSKKFMIEFEKVRAKENLSQNKLAKLIGIRPQTITQIKNGKQEVQVDVLRTFSEMYGYDFNFFYEENYQKSPSKINQQLEEQFELIRKNNEMLVQLFQTGIELTNSQIVYMKNLKIMME